MSDKQTYSIELSVVMRDYLEQMVSEYALPDVDKAVRCLINYARANPEKQSEIFQEIRCLDC